jgi:hypothetical protein
MADIDIRGIVEWLDGSIWADDMYDYTGDLSEEFGSKTVQRYWNYNSIISAMRDLKFEGWRYVLAMLTYMISSDWDLALAEYFDDIADAWGRSMACKFNIESIVRFIEFNHQI